MSSLSESDLQRFFQNLENRPLEPDDLFYEAYLDNNPDDPIKELVRDITWAKQDSVNLLSGQRGSGKSTELRRLRHLLTEKGYVVFFCDMQGYMNFHFPIEITDFLISIMLALSEAIREKYGKNFTKRGYGERFKDFMTQTKIEFGGIDFAGGNGEAPIKVALKQDPTIKQRLQNALRGHVTKIVQQAHEFSQDMVNFVRQQTDDKIVLLIDSVEQIRGVGENAKAVHDSVSNLFGYHSDKLHLTNFHTVYTVPPYLPPLAPALGRLLDSTIIRSIDNVHVFHRDGTPDPTGLAVMENIIQRRFSHWQQIFSREQLRNMILATGGDLRDFFRLIRNILIKAAPLREGFKPLLPVADNIINNAKNHLRRDILPIAEQDMDWLIKIADTKEAKLPSIDELPRLARFFDNNLVQNYRNGDDWYDLHPLLKDVITV
ncbi:MAG: hypothetical protein DRR08_10475 [Candidatus Parabeggiatoa sp. nov. 2]|nr:MAG: hypothetical protein B6247_20510 [Beggiatoa sp. 4572_84]RKZ60761.1 MAG: hypothetical protein DRR08_10475 [Gammaproteobacteria bacterium]HEC84867.1 hypothetical protein [Thioploca sp.]